MKYNPRTKDRTFKETARFMAGLLGNINGKLLDIGCHKVFLKDLLPSVDYVGLNIDKTAPCVIEHDLNTGKLPFKDKTFDYVVCANILEHLFCPESILKEMHRVMKDGGKGIISLPNDSGICSRYTTLVRPIKSYEEQIYRHHWRFSIKTATDFVSKRFVVEKRAMYNGIYLRRLDFILKYFPGTCSDHYMVVRKKTLL